MGAIGSMMGFSGGANGTGFSGPAQADQQGMNNLQDSYTRLISAAQGNGPNPAMAQYNQNVQNLAKQQSGAISSIQGISPALAARMASQQGSGAMQNAAAAGATTQAQQQLGAMNSAAGVAANQAGTAAQMQGNINNVNGSLANTTMQGQQNFIGGLMNGAGAAAGMANGGQVMKMAEGGMPGPQSDLAQFLTNSQGSVSRNVPQVEMASTQAPVNATADAFKMKSKKPAPTPAPENAGQGPTMANAATLPASTIPYSQPMTMAKGGKVNAMVSPGELWLPPGKVQQVAKGKDPMQVGEKIPGKPKVAGNSYANDVVPKKLGVGGIVIPNSIMQSDDPAGNAKDFIAQIIAKRGTRK